MGIFGKLKSALSKTSDKIKDSIDHVFVKQKLDAETLQELEDVLLSSDVGINVTEKIIDSLKKDKFNKEVTSEEVRSHMASVIEELLIKQNHEFKMSSDKLNVILVCGVNGNGKTTSIGKLAKIYKDQGMKVGIAACDTFRAAAVEQIKVWADRTGSDFYSGEDKSDPASVAYKAVEESIANGTKVLFIDTAGRLHNQKNLMEELAKIVRVIKKKDESFPHHALLVLDGTTGQNAMIQAEEFKNLCDISGMIITKLDGTSRAGVVVGIVDKFNIPVHFIGVGEAVEDLKEFSAPEFAKSIVGM